MAQVISTILFNGQFWIALIEKYEEDGSLFIGKYTFGPEPNNTDLIDFYQNKYQSIRFYQSEKKVRIKSKYSEKELKRNIKKSFAEFKAEQKKYLLKRKQKHSRNNKESKNERFLKKIEKKKDKKRGH